MDKKTGFTLVEIMVVVAIIAIIAAVANSSYRTFSAKSKWGEVQPCLSDVALRMENYRTNHGVYPDPDLDDDISTSWEGLGTTGDCSDHYAGGVTVFDNGARYIIAFCDSVKPIWDTGVLDTWIMIDTVPTVIHYQNPVEETTETVDADYLAEMPSPCD